jgi:hypothetical protein
VPFDARFSVSATHHPVYEYHLRWMFYSYAEAWLRPASEREADVSTGSHPDLCSAAIETMGFTAVVLRVTIAIRWCN